MQGQAQPHSRDCISAHVHTHAAARAARSKRAAAGQGPIQAHPGSWVNYPLKAFQHISTGLECAAAYKSPVQAHPDMGFICGKRAEHCHNLSLRGTHCDCSCIFHLIEKSS
eukprot:79557-Pelagomonas_calceolata.AAC.1